MRPDPHAGFPRVVLKLAITLLALSSAGYMVVDGVFALLTGSYITPSSGEYAGQLGPWAGVVKAVGIQPTSTLMKLVFVGYGTTWLVVLGCFWAGLKWAPRALLLLAAGSLWYLWIGTASAIVQLVLLTIWIVRR